MRRAGCINASLRPIVGRRKILSPDTLIPNQMRHHCLVTAASLLVVLAVNGATARAQMSRAGSQTLRPGDHLRITVLSDDKNLSGEFEVASDSSLKHPLYNRIKVVGIPLTQLRPIFTSFLKQLQREPQVEVEPLFKVTVTGEVKSPNFFLLPPEATLREAITRAGGPTEKANLEKVTVIRDGRKLSLDLRQNNSPPEILTIQSGDEVSLAPRRNFTAGIGSLTPLFGVAASLLSAIYLLSR